MKLFLSSFGLGRNPDRLFSLVNRQNPVVLVIANALENFPSVRARILSEQIEALQILGFSARELDLRAYFEDTSDLKSLVLNSQLIWATGGNTFLLRRAMRQSGFDDILRQSVQNDAIVYGGFSAGAVVVAPTLHGIDLIDDPNGVSAGYDPAIIWEGIGLIDFFLAVHFKSDHPESPLVDEVVDYFKANDCPYRTLADGEALIVDNGQIEMI